MKKEIVNKYFDYINEKIDNINYDTIYDCIMDHNSISVFSDDNSLDEDTSSLYCDSITFSNKKAEVNKNDIELTIMFNLKYYVEIDNKIIKELNRRRIKYNATFKSTDNSGYLIINLDDVDNLMEISDFINIRFSKILDDFNPFLFGSGKIVYSFDEEYSYLDILIKYLVEFCLKMQKNHKELSFDNFKDYMIDVYFKIENQVDLYKFLKFNTKKIPLGDFFVNLEIMTSLIMYLFNGSNYTDFIDYYNKITKKNSFLIKKYSCYNNLKEDEELLEEMLNELVGDFDKEEIIKSLTLYKETAKPDYITRKHDIRKNVMSSKTFLVYLYQINLKEKLEELIPLAILKNKKKLLEDICKDNYISYNKSDNLGKVQVIRGLIRMEYGDYTAITRKNNARKIAADNINPDEVFNIIKFTLNSNEDEKENELYEKYANYIEGLCN